MSIFDRSERSTDAIANISCTLDHDLPLPTSSCCSTSNRDVAYKFSGRSCGCSPPGSGDERQPAVVLAMSMSRW